MGHRKARKPPQNATEPKARPANQKPAAAKRGAAGKPAPKSTKKPAAAKSRPKVSPPRPAAKSRPPAKTPAPKSIADKPIADLIGEAKARNAAAEAIIVGDAAKYAQKKERERRRNSANAAAGRDIGKIPAVGNQERRDACEFDLELYALTYFPHKFFHGFSDDLREALAILQRTILEGGCFALAMPRGGGKSTIAEVGALWATTYGHRAFVVVVGASKPLAVQLLENVQAELLTNDALAEDFPEVVFPIRALENIANRSAGQLCQGKPTYIKWKRDRVVFATIAGSKSSGAILRAAGLTSGIRGVKEKQRRPDLAIVDDWQTDASARSASQTKNRIKLINGAVRGLAGPGKKIAVYAPMTVIVPGDGADQLLNVRDYPEWQGRRFSLLKAFPTNVELWNQYDEIRRASLLGGGDGSEAREFYREHREAMDVGGVVAWEARKYPDDVSALEHAMQLYYADPISFFAEYQNQPKADADDGQSDELKASEIAKRKNGLKARVVPRAASRVTCYVDVQWSLFYYVVVAWGEDFSGDVVEYGTYPDQGRTQFKLRDARKKLAGEFPNATTEAAVESGLHKLTEQLVARRYARDGEEGEPGDKIELICVDWSDGNLQETIARVCRTSPHAALLIPTEGVGIGPADLPMYKFKLRENERLGARWILRRNKGVLSTRIDSNFWKSRVADALLAPLHNPGSIRLYGTRGTDHEMFAAHCCAEKRSRLTNEKTRRTVDVWKLPANKPDNHLWDCLCGAAVAASLRGCKIAPTPPAPPKSTPPGSPTAKNDSPTNRATPPRERVRPLQI